MKTFIFTLTFLNLMACSQQDYAEDELLETSVQMLKYMCENRQSCLEQVEFAAKDCKNAENGVNIPPNAFGDPKMAASVELQVCIIQQMDDAFMAKYNQVFPVTETEVQSSSNSSSTEDFLSSSSDNSFAFLSDPQVLQIKEVEGQFEIFNQTLNIKKIEDFLKQKELTKEYQSAVLIVSDELALNLMFQAKDAIKQAGFKKITLASKERLAEFNRKK